MRLDNLMCDYHLESCNAKAALAASALSPLLFPTARAAGFAAVHVDGSPRSSVTF